MANGAKTHRGAAKRFKKTAKGKVVYRKMGMRHGLSNKTRKQKRHRKGAQTLSKAMQRRVTRLLAA